VEALQASGVRVLFRFFFSSRRRHTRFSRDWSSDVCSSDLIHPEQDRAEVLDALAAVDAVVVFDEDTPHDIIGAVQPDVLVKGARSEERRVGKECRSRWAT